MLHPFASVSLLELITFCRQELSGIFSVSLVNSNLSIDGMKNANCKKKLLPLLRSRFIVAWVQEDGYGSKDKSRLERTF